MNDDALSDISIENLPIGDIEIDIPQDEPAELTEEEKLERRQELIRRQEEIQESYKRILNSPNLDEERKNDTYIETHCANTEDLSGDPLTTKGLIVFMKEDSNIGECYLRTDLEELFLKAEEVYIWKGPPSPYISLAVNGAITRGEPDKDNPVCKLAYSGIWIDKFAIDKALELRDKPITTIQLYKSEKQSIGSAFGISALHGQWGGHWRPIVGMDGRTYAEYVKKGNAELDERYNIYTTN